MKNIILLLSFCFASFLFSNHLIAQVKVSKKFTQKLKEMELEFLEPLEQSYKKTRIQKNIILDYDFAIKARKTDMEIRFALFPEKENANTFPHINVMSLASSVATNEDEEARMVLHEMSKTDLKSYNADWGAVVFFQPKRIFTDKDHCKMLALYQEGKGLAYVFYLFDEATEEVDIQKYCLNFLSKDLKNDE